MGGHGGGGGHGGHGGGGYRGGWGGGWGGVVYADPYPVFYDDDPSVLLYNKRLGAPLVMAGEAADAMAEGALDADPTAAEATGGGGELSFSRGMRYGIVG